MEIGTTALEGVLVLTPKRFGDARGFSSESFDKCTDYYAPDCESPVKWGSCGVDWPASSELEPVLPEKDTAAPNFAEFDSPFEMGAH